MTEALLILYQRQCLLDEVVAFAQLVYCVVDKVARYIIEAVTEIVQFLGVMPVVVEHVLQKCESFLRRGCCCM